MTPLTENPRVVVLVDREGNVLRLATNVSPELNIEVVVANNNGDIRPFNTFDEESLGFPFKS